MEPKERAERFRKARIDLNRNGAKTLEQVYQDTGITKSQLSDLESDMKDRGVKYQDIAKLAGYYGVSVDYLVGTSEIPSIEPDIQAAAKLTGLDSSAIEALVALNNYPEGRSDNVKGTLQILDVILNDLRSDLDKDYSDTIRNKFPEDALKNIAIQYAVNRSLLSSLWKYYIAFNQDLYVIPSPLGKNYDETFKYIKAAKASDNVEERGLNKLMAEVKLLSTMKEIPVLIGGRDIVSLDVEEIYFASMSREIISRLEKLKPKDDEEKLEYGNDQDADK